MSPFSFLSYFAFPTFPSISVPDIGSYLPENIQKRLVSYLLQRTLGKFVQKDGLQLERIEAEIKQGRIRLEGLQIDVESVNAILPPDSAYRIREGHLDVIDICLPFPNIWSGPLSLNVSAIQIVLETIPESSTPSAQPSGNDAREWDLNQSLHVASDDFVRTILNKEEESQLHNPVHGFRRTALQESTACDPDPFALDDDHASETEDDDGDTFSAPGGFPTRSATAHSAGNHGGSPAAMIESLMETLLARLQVVVDQVVVRYHHEGSSSKHAGSANVIVDFRMDGIRYALNQTNSTSQPKKTLTIDDLSIWLANKNNMEEKAEETLVPPVDRGTKDEVDMMMSLGIADLRESRYGQETVARPRSPIREADEDEDAGPALSLYESAIGETQEHSPLGTSLGDNRSTSSAKSALFPREGTKIFGIQEEGIVIQMWKEALPIDERSRSSKGNDAPEATSQGQISVDLGRMALKLDMEQLKALMTVIGPLVPKSPRKQSKETDPAPTQKHSRSTDSRIRVALTSLDMHYLYNDRGQQSSRSETFWKTLDPQIIEEDRLQLQILRLAVNITEADGLTVGFGGIAVYDIHQAGILEAGLLAQPLLICGWAEIPRNTWLPRRDVTAAKSAVLSGNDAHAQGRIRISMTGKYLLDLTVATLFNTLFFVLPGRSIQLGHVQLFFDPAVVNRLFLPVQQASTIYAKSNPIVAVHSTGGDASQSASGYWCINLDVITLKMYRTSSDNGHLGPQHRPEGMLTCRFEAISFDQSPDAAIQASLEYMTAVFENEAGNALIWLTGGTPPSQGWSQRALDLSYLPSRSRRISVAISIVAFDLDQQISHGLQYFADDYATWFDAMSTGPDATGMSESQSQGIHTIRLDDFTAGSDSSCSTAADEEALHIECVVLKASMRFIADDKNITLEATDIDATVHDITGTKVKVELHIIKEAQFRPEPYCEATCVTTTEPVTQEQETRFKESIISLDLSNTFLNITPGVPWIDGLRSVLSSPAGVFENMVPSDSTKVTVVVQDCTAFLPAIKRPGAISVDIGNCSLKTRFSPMSSRKTVDCKLTDIAISLSDDFAPSNMRKHGTNGMTHVDYDFALSFLLKESRLLFGLGSGGRTKIDISYASIDVPLCADTRETFQEVVQDISDGWNFVSKDFATGSSSQTSTPSGFEAVPDIKSLLGSLSDLAPSLAASSFEEDLLRDDLPSNADFVRGNSSTPNRIEVPHHDNHVLEDKEMIRILYNESFDLYQDYLTKLDETVHQNNDSGGSSLIVIGTAINIRILLHGGYDWETTRSAIESETDALRRRLRKLSQLISSGSAPAPELRRTHVELFNSIHIGNGDDEDYQDHDQLLAAINDELADLDSETASNTTYKTQPAGRLDDGSARQSKGRQKKLSRSRRPQMEMSLQDAAFRYTIEDPEADVVGSFKLTLQKAEIIDHIKSSTWKTFMTAMKKVSTRDILETEAKMLRIVVDWVNPGIRQMAEARANVGILDAAQLRQLTATSFLQIEVAPLRFHVDQDALDFMKRFFSFTRKRSQATSPLPESPKLNSKNFIQHVEIQPIVVKMDYKPKRLNLKALQQGSAMEVINLFHFESATMTLRHVSINGVSSWGELYSKLLAIWTPDVKSNQMSDLLTGIAPVRSMVKAGTGVADLILLPLAQYRKDGKIVKGIRRGASSFASNTLSEVATVGAQLATGTQVILERAERALGGRQPEYPDLPDMMESINLADYDAGRARKTSRYADQPASVNQGIAAAYTSLASNLTSAAQTILAVPMEVLDETSGQTPSFQSATRAVIRAVPIAVLQGMIGVTDASRKTLFGVKNQLDPKNQGDRESKYKRR
ncbi:hypothetical protein QFC21_001687 [Naganishia friedmannii]|uniref:Uncharacterized protein n=1 Tax=Naganishia friedmannii TaxID=89922 RepID=A0ACC2W1X7_9TREE|nr:hypothetical protein QFC21_001687 [Naganishia friedmannii]